MKALHKSYIVFSLALLLSIFVVFGATFTSSVDPSNINEDVSYLFNFTINNNFGESVNLTHVNVTLPTGFSFTSFDTNGSSSTIVNFTNSTGNVLIWTNSTVNGFVVNQTTEYIWFNATAAIPGSYNFTVGTIDISGGANTTNIAVTVNDTTIPVVTEVVAPTAGNTNSSILINYTATDNVGVTDFNITVNDTLTITQYVMENTGQYYTFTLNISASSLLSVYYNLTFKDAAGNINRTDTVTVAVTDNQNPTWNETLTNQTIEYNTHFYYDVNASDNIGISVYFINSSADAGNFTIDAASGLIENNTLLALGDYALNISVNDTAGNIISDYINVSVVDSLAPTIVYDAPTSQQDYNFSQSYIEMNITAVDLGGSGLDTITVYLYNSSGDLRNTSTSTTSSFYINYTGLIDGNYSFNASANDSAGNINYTITRNVVLDNVAPAVTAVAAPTAGTTNDSILVNYTVIDAVLVVTDFNIIVNDTLTVTEYVMTQQGNDYTFYINVSASNVLPIYYNTTFRDSVGNINMTDTVIMAVTDNDLPTWNETLINQTIEFGDAFYYDVNASDNVAVGTYVVDDTNNFTVNSASGLISNATYLSLSDIPLNISVNDTAGNTISVFINVSVVDTTIPVFSPALTNQNVELGSAFNYDVNATDLQTVTFAINDTTNFNISSTGLITNYTVLSLGAYGLQVNATDASGNVNSSIITVTVGDNIAPIASGGSPTGTITNSTPELNVTSNENATCKFSVDAEYNYTTMNYTFSGTSLAHNYTLITALSGSGTSHTVYSRCNDTTGNVATTSYSWSFTVGTAASSGGGGSSGGSQVISVTSNDLVHGKTLSVVKGDKILITLRGSSHTIEVESINSILGKVTIIIRSDPISVTLKEGETRFVDVNNDKMADLEITLKSIGLSGVDLEIKEVTVKMPSEEVVEAVKDVAEEVSEDEQIEKIVREIAREVELTEFKMTSDVLVGIIVAVIILVFLGYKVLLPNLKSKSHRKSHK